MRSSFMLTLLGALAVVAAVFFGVYSLWHRGEAARAAAMGVPYTTFNVMTQHALDRGCEACHTDRLASDLNSLVVPRDHPIIHGEFVTSYGIAMRVEDCLPCHGERTTLPFAEDIHALHLGSTAFANMGGSCESCHATVKGQLVLYDDETRYALMNGIVEIPTPVVSKDVSGDVSSWLGRPRSRSPGS